ncbi:YihY/virulence factor BrkB family protein [Neolewinella aurantiaca]|uniref:YihY/virulence factor BrkB family protein n=1 Tax=Neolewinella aurantiaca TaxID=2602767 RepID=A0A5C7G105_9BACT|nr:YihY/virulence factor BrkB family protein [Neolewinella aurantiaca]TXF91449.1 YihY/virulence factor BrkB family protein [Neolewinella aurantiaca]
MEETNIFKRIFAFSKDVISQYMDDDALNLGAALAYYTVFSFAPMLVVATTVASYFFGQEAISGRLNDEMEGLLGRDAANSLSEIISNAYVSGDTVLATTIGVATLIFAATGVFGNLKISLNKIWNIQPTPTNGILAFVFTRLLSFGFVVGLGFLLMITLVINALVIGFMDQIGALFPALSSLMLGFTSWAATTIVTAFIFVLLFRYLPDAQARWRDLWAGAIFTALLFGLGRFLIGFYIGNSDFSSTYGAAGALITLLVWTYYNSQILFLGAEFTQVWAQWKGNPIIPDEHAVKVRREMVEVDRNEVRPQPAGALKAYEKNEEVTPKLVNNKGDDAGAK